MKLAATIPPRLDAYRGRATGWWQARSGREQGLLAILAVLAGLAALVELVVLPWAAATADARRDIATYDALQARIRALGPAARAPGGIASGDVASLARASAAGFGLTVTSITPDGPTARAALIGAGYDPLVRWLAALQREHGVRVDQMTLRRAAQPGLVDVTLVLAR